MTRTTQYVDAFWDPDFTNTKGFEILSKRNKDIRKVSKELEDYYKERAKAEQVYSKAIQALVRKLEAKEEIGDLGKAVRELKTQTERIARTHEQAGSDFQILYNELSKFDDDHKSIKQQIEDRTKSSQNDKIQKYKACMSCKEKYITKCKEKEAAEETFNQARQSVQITSKDLAKVGKAKEKADEAQQQADVNYKNAVQAVEISRKIWEKEMEDACNQFQRLEEQRVGFFRDSIWKCTNVDSKACVDHDECAEAVRNVLQYCDISKDLQEFIDNNKLSGRRPEPIVFEDYDRRAPSTPPRSHTMRPPQPLPPIQQPRVPPPRPSEGPLISFDEDSRPSGPGLTPGSLVNILKSYQAKSPSELTVEIGQKVEFMRDMKAGMTQVKVGERCGLIPTACVRMGTTTYL
ncbi:proline-serine-threonine phosphatase-interacting protein 2-like isoform X2 [Saccostrea echinata]|uniref:proline-serine-threonine phosphatase-interacting protein 2-like isoform X2 n=1 Tax=Saccostrea echinata TaxID=191078 RepID=UPI002A841410|nr:proline-serine-threonine phosphatase-interacting protein 2-like isoform X2 [Saccostrea echinata]